VGFDPTVRLLGIPDENVGLLLIPANFGGKRNPGVVPQRAGESAGHIEDGVARPPVHDPRRKSEITTAD